MRDLTADLEFWKDNYTDRYSMPSYDDFIELCDRSNNFIPEAIERAIKAESENAKLREVANIAREWLEFDFLIGIPIEDDAADNQAKRFYYQTLEKFKKALAEVDKEAE